MGRIMAIDYGTRRTGIAVSDPLRIIAGGLVTVETKELERWLADYFAREDVSTIVLGKRVFGKGTPVNWKVAGRMLIAWLVTFPAGGPSAPGLSRQGGLLPRRALHLGDGAPHDARKRHRPHGAPQQGAGGQNLRHDYFAKLYGIQPMIYPIVIYGDEMLRKHCTPLEPGTLDVKQLEKDMFLTLEEAGGVGLAAPQIGKDIRFFIVDCTPWAEEDPSCADYRRAFVNAEIYEYSDEKKSYNEGCLSFPGLYADVTRSLSIRMRYLDTDFVEHDEEFTGLKAWVIQHEYDHIEGTVFTDRVSPLRRQLLKGKLLNLAKGKYRCAYKTK